MTLPVLAALELLRKLFSQSGLDESDEGPRASVPFGHRAQNELPIFRESAVSLGDEDKSCRILYQDVVSPHAEP